MSEAKPSKNLPRIAILLALLLQAAAFALPDYWYHGPISRDINLPPEPGPLRRFYLVEEIHSIFNHHDGDAPALDYASRAAIPLSAIAFLFFFLRCRRVAIGFAFFALAAWIARYWLCCPRGFHVGYYSWLAGILLLGLAAFAARGPLGAIGKWTGRITIAVLIAALAIGLIYHATTTGPIDPTGYPPRESSLYCLPFPPGSTFFCTQGNGGLYSHYGWQHLAYDFSMPVGTDVLAARAGKVVDIEVRYDGHGLNNNYITIAHGDGSFAHYLHLMKGGSYVRTGDHVVQGQRIAASGDVGLSTSPHLHFHVTWKAKDGYGWILPVTFADVDEDFGIPRTMHRYTSKNVPATP